MASVVAGHLERSDLEVITDGLRSSNRVTAAETSALRREIEAAMIRNGAAVEAAKRQADDTLTGEERTRHTLRGLMEILSGDDAGSGA